MQLPDLIPVFPLPNVVLFPHVDLPLHIFEPRYREMVQDAMASHRLIGMALLRGDWRRDYLGTPDVFPLGCVGRIESFQLQPDGRSNLVLRGLRRFEIVEDVPGKIYRQARVRWYDETPVAADGERLTRSVDRLRSTVTRLLERTRNTASTEVWERLPAEPDPLVCELAFGLDLTVIEKLSVLECSAALERCERLIEILEFRLAEVTPGKLDEGGEGPWH